MNDATKNIVLNLIDGKGICWFLPRSIRNAVSVMWQRFCEHRSDAQRYKDLWDGEVDFAAKTRLYVEKLEKQNSDLHKQIQDELKNVVAEEEKAERYRLQVAELIKQRDKSPYKTKADKADRLEVELAKLKDDFEKAKTALNQQGEEKNRRIGVLEKRIKEMTNTNAELNEELIRTSSELGKSRTDYSNFIEKFRSLVSELPK